MTTLLDELANHLTPRTVEQLEKMLDVNSSVLKSGIQAAGAVLLSAASLQAAAPEGADELLASLKLDKELQTEVMDATVAGHGYPILDFLFGVGLPKVESWLRDTASVEVAPYLPVTAPLFMHVVLHAVRAQNLDSAGLAKFLRAEHAAFVRAQPQLASQINAALDLGQNTVERAERNLARFTPEEWEALSKVPALAGNAVMLAAWSGPRGLQLEFDALQTAMAECGGEHEPDSLVGLVSDPLTGPAQLDALGVTQANAMSLTRDACLDALAILNDKATHEEIVAYKEFVVSVATRVAEAAKDGGVLGIGGAPVSAAEQATLDLIAAALAYAP